MPWVRLDEEFPHHPKVVGVGPLGIAMQVVGLCYCNKFLTDGFIPSSAIPTFMDFTELDEQAFNGHGGVCWIAVGKLVDAGIWNAVDGGYQIHDFADYQPTKAQVQAERNAKVAAGRAGGIAAAIARAKAPAVAESKPVPVPVPVLEKEPLSTEVRKRRTVKYTVLAAATSLLEMFSEDERTEMERLFYGISVEWEAGKCVDWWNAKGGSANWKLAFKNWLGRAQPSLNRSGHGSPETNPLSPDYKPIKYTLPEGAALGR